MSYEDRQSLFFLFTVTRSDSGMPLTDWLVEDQIIELDAHHTSQEIGLFLEKIMNYHSQAYDYEVGDRQRQIRRGAAEHLALGMKNDKLSIRSVVRLSVELFDLLFLYPGYEVAVQVEHALEFLNAYLPPEILSHLELDKLTLQPGNYVDERLQRHMSDILYEAPLIPSAEEDSSRPLSISCLSIKVHPKMRSHFSYYAICMNVGQRTKKMASL